MTDTASPAAVPETAPAPSSYTLTITDRGDADGASKLYQFDHHTDPQASVTVLVHNSDRHVRFLGSTLAARRFPWEILKHLAGVLPAQAPTRPDPFVLAGYSTYHVDQDAEGVTHGFQHGGLASDCFNAIVNHRDKVVELVGPTMSASHVPFAIVQYLDRIAVAPPKLDPPAPEVDPLKDIPAAEADPAILETSAAVAVENAKRAIEEAEAALSVVKNEEVASHHEQALLAAFVTATKPSRKGKAK